MLSAVLGRFRCMPLKQRDRVPRRAGRADDLERREDVGENPGLAFDQAFERHALMQMDSVLHDEVLVTGMKDLRIDRGHHLDGEIVRSDNADLKTRKPARAFEADARRAVIEGAKQIPRV
ncbi:hypothetical protein [Rhodoblastus sp.]|uniref:hypothetical protein n=1 Tax=Rhodoblastus sp. TaxID=1962975 RepID=UPI003F95AA6F